MQRNAIGMGKRTLEGGEDEQPERKRPALARYWEFFLLLNVHDLLKLYNDINVPPERLLFKIPSTWQGIEAANLLESEGIQTHLTFVYRIKSRGCKLKQGTNKIVSQHQTMPFFLVVSCVKPKVGCFPFSQHLRVSFAQVVATTQVGASLSKF
ncbi:hypothetical protein K1719_045054 [Acacia pycnantha]|nr:hypothetical protein K1719_045054 [Acacia pycnantha]